MTMQVASLVCNHGDVMVMLCSYCPIAVQMAIPVCNQ